MRRTLMMVVLAATALIAGCSSSHSKSNATTEHATASHSPQPPASSTADASAQATIDLSPNWKAMKADIKSTFQGTCLLSYACTGTDALSTSIINANFIDATGQESIAVSVLETDARDNTAAKVDLGHFALFFATDSHSQFDFQNAVMNALDAIPIGGTKVSDYTPLRVSVQHPTAAKWQFTIDRVPLT